MCVTFSVDDTSGRTVFLILPILQNVARLASQHMADGFQRTEAHGLGLTRLQDG